jgi:hypothetical protein
MYTKNIRVAEETMDYLHDYVRGEMSFRACGFEVIPATIPI